MRGEKFYSQVEAFVINTSKEAKYMATKFIMSVKCLEGHCGRYLIATEINSEEEKEKLKEELIKNFKLTPWDRNQRNLDWRTLKEALKDATGYDFELYRPDLAIALRFGSIYEGVTDVNRWYDYWNYEL